MEKDNIFSRYSGFTLSGISMYNSWIIVENTIEVAFYDFIGGVVGMFGRWLMKFLISKWSSYFKR